MPAGSDTDPCVCGHPRAAHEHTTARHGLRALRLSEVRLRR